jgi:hypothetical protein
MRQDPFFYHMSDVRHEKRKSYIFGIFTGMGLMFTLLYLIGVWLDIN